MKSVRFMGAREYQSHYGPMKIMEDSESNSDGESDCEWLTKDLSMSEQMGYKGKTLGRHKTSSYDIVRALYQGQGCASPDANEIASKYTKLYERRQLTMLADLGLIFGKGKVQQTVNDLSSFKEGAVILIPKGDISWLSTRQSRYRAIVDKIHFAEDASRTNGSKLLTKAFKARSVQCANAEISSRIQEALFRYGFREISVNGDNIVIGDNDMNICRLSIKEKYELKTFLRWNSWLLFENAVSELTTEANPTEWDSLVGKTWRSIFGKAVRFEEQYL